MIRAARYLGVPPWELVDRPTAWVKWAVACQEAEQAAEEYSRKHKRNS